MTRADRAKYVSIPEAKHRLNVSRFKLTGMLARGELQGERIAGRTLILKASLDTALSRLEKPVPTGLPTDSTETPQ